MEPEENVIKVLRENVVQINEFKDMKLNPHLHKNLIKNSPNGN